MKSTQKCWKKLSALRETKRRLNETRAEADEYHQSNKKLREDLNSNKEMMKFIFDDDKEDVFEENITVDECSKASTAKTDPDDNTAKEKPIQTVFQNK